MLSREKYEGSVIHGTARLEDLIPTFIQTLDTAIEDLRKGSDEDRITAEQLAEELASIEKELETIPNYFETEGAMHDLIALENTLDTIAPDGLYFGSHPGDGCDYGFWPAELQDEG